MNSTSHVIFGIVLYLFIFKWLNLPLDILSAITVILASLLPDIDLNSSYISKMWKRFSSIIWGLVGIVVLIILLDFLSSGIGLIPRIFSVNFYDTFYLYFGLFLILAYYPYFIRRITRHRGLTHQIIYMVVLIGFIYFITNVEIALAFGIGYFSHLIADKYF